VRRGCSGLAKKRLQGRKELLGLFDIRYVPAML
jgi:hypothetical protein